MHLHIKSIFVTVAMFFVMIQGAAYSTGTLNKTGGDGPVSAIPTSVKAETNGTGPLDALNSTKLMDVKVNSTSPSGSVRVAVPVASFVLAFAASWIRELLSRRKFYGGKRVGIVGVFLLCWEVNFENRLSGVEFRLALADTDVKLENVLKTYLCPMLLKLASSHDVVRKKVVQICNHICIRVKSNENIKLPINTLLEQFHNKDVENATKSFTLLFLDMAFFKLNEQEKKEILSRLIPGLSTYSVEHKKRIIHLIFHVLAIYGDVNEDFIGEFENDNSLKSVFSSNAYSEDFSFLAKVFKDLSLFSLSYFHSLSKKVLQTKVQEPFSNSLDNSGLSTDFDLSFKISVLKKTCPGLSFDSFKLLTPKEKDTFSNIELLNKIKIGVIWFLSTSYFSLDQKFTTLNIFKFDIDHNINCVASICLKKLPIVNIEDEKIVENIYDLLLGTSEGPETMHKGPVSSQIYVHFINLLSKSRVAIKNVENIPKLLGYGLQSDLQKLREATVTFIYWIATTLSDGALKSISIHILNLLLTYIQNNDNKSETLKERLFASLGLVAKRGMNNMEISILKFLFDSLKKETKLVRFSIEQSLSLIMPCFQDAQGRLLDELNALLFEIIVSNHINMHFSALRYCLTIFPFHESKARMLCLLCLRDNCKPEVIEEAKKGLDPYWFLAMNKTKDVKQTLNNIFSKNNMFSFPVFEDLIEVLENQKVNSEGDNFFSQRFELQAPGVKNYMVKFIRQTLIMNLLQFDKNIGKLVPFSRTWEEQLDIAINNNFKFRAAYKKGFDISWNNNSKFKKYLTIYFQYLANRFFEMPSEFAYNVLELLSFGPSDLTVMLTDKIGLFQTIVLSSKENNEYDVSRILGIVVSHFDVPIEKIKELKCLIVAFVIL
ncbi:hypothetical protein PORY_002783 [Pneumocystis oryctolagi]|uniref:Uncharacterized protein n=1 Tax=Pneumocystis oryctolagi TaxID=42067 RepID=A0ACB7C9X7_9ASCO|nr:hypothetical protein PORY_002783 [Pneumocystis oryctolagi]